MKTLVVYCQHGDERFGVLVAAEAAKRDIDTVLANPEAFLNGRRYVDEDLNRSYQSQAHTYEAGRARAVKTLAKQYDLVVDIHTSTVAVGEVAIVASDSPDIIELCARLGCRRVAVMPKSIAEQALIGHAPCVISLEFGSDLELSAQYAEQVSGRIALPATLPPRVAVQVYYVKDVLPEVYKKSSLKNYVFDEYLQGYPFLFGESNYETYAGFFADRLQRVIIGDTNE